MPASGYGGSVTGVALGTFPNIANVVVEGIDAQVKIVRRITDPDKIGTKLPTAVDEGNAIVTMDYDGSTKVLYGQLRAYASGHTQDTFTIIDSVGNKHEGLGRIVHCGDIDMNTTDEMTFRVIIAPVTSWAFTPAI